MRAEERATIFGSEAERYDRYRPGYPVEVIDMVLEGRPSTAVDAGCGTGKAAVLVAGRGVDVIGVEPDARMADVARRHGIEVVVSSLEDWDVVECDVMYAAQAWHWIDPVRGAEVAAAAIRPGGRWLAFWNDEVDEEFGRARNGVYRRLAPELVDRLSSANDDDFRSALAEALGRTGSFGAMAVDDVAWTDRLPVAVAVQRLASHSSHRLLDPEVSDEIDEALRAELGAATDLIDLSYVTRTFSACRR